MFTPGTEVVEVEAKAGGLFYVTPNSRREIWLLYMDRASTGNNPHACGQYGTRDEAIDAARDFEPLQEQYGPYTGPEAREYLLRARKPGAVAGAGGPIFACYDNSEE